eukprot:TRINITY_DN4216_c0_g1_i3.p1 TRINITY_DN4216_c0_g1~~TRINITY_DN4216_c0_g1_i3.p1  ORF type:complete len:105 (-),score=11.68 TRINITY_DN4216_c0_g1_i3:265-579(-)
MRENKMFVIDDSHIREGLIDRSKWSFPCCEDRCPGDVLMSWAGDVHVFMVFWCCGMTALRWTGSFFFVKWAIEGTRELMVIVGFFFQKGLYQWQIAALLGIQWT